MSVDIYSQCPVIAYEYFATPRTPTESSALRLALSSQERGIAVRVQRRDATDHPNFVLRELALGGNLHVPFQRL
jgi:hypothetical protein